MWLVLSDLQLKALRTPEHRLAIIGSDTVLEVRLYGCSPAQITASQTLD